MRVFLAKLRGIFSGHGAHDDEEMRTHLALLAERFERQGMTPKEAAAAARRQFGNVTVHEQSLREMRMFVWMSSLGRDLRFALRRLRKSPGFAVTAVLTLALGIGAATAIFSVVDSVLLKPLAYRDGGQLVVVWERVKGLEKLFPYVGPNPKHAQMWASRSTDFDGLALIQSDVDGISRGNDHPRPVGHLSAQTNLLDVLGVEPALGRNFRAEESQPGRGHVVLLTWELWQTLFHGDAAVIGQTLRVGDVPHEIIGVLPKSFYFPKANELTAGMLNRGAVDLPTVSVITPVPSTFDVSWSMDYGNYIAIGRLKRDVRVADATTQLNAIDNAMIQEFGKADGDGFSLGDLTTYVQPLKEVLVGRSRTMLWLLFAATMVVLLIACVNLANAQLARSIARDRESALRAALGATAWSLLQASMAEVAILSVVGGALGIGLATVMVQRIEAYVHLAMARTENLGVNLTVLGLSIALTVGAMFLFGLLPALRQFGIRPQQALQNSTRAAGSRRGHTLRRWLIGAQIFACTALLLVAGLFVKSLDRLFTVDKGFNADHVLMASIEDEDPSQTPAQQAAFRDGVLERLRALPGAKSAAMVNVALLNGESNIDGVARPNTGPNLLANYRWVSPDYFSTMQQRMAQGREFEAQDRDKPVAILAQKTARVLFGDEEAVGREIRHNNKSYVVVGVAADAHSTSLRAAPVNVVYLPHWDRPRPYGQFLVRSEQDPSLLFGEVRNAVWSYSPGATLTNVTTLGTQVSTALTTERIETIVLSVFGGSALLLALLGIYGTLSYSVATRKQEIGIRMALGASRRSVYGVTLREILLPVGMGLALGWVVSLGIGRGVASLLYGTAPMDGTVALAVLCLFTIAAAGATYVPCRRATRIEPMEALRAE